MESDAEQDAGRDREYEPETFRRRQSAVHDDTVERGYAGLYHRHHDEQHAYLLHGRRGDHSVEYDDTNGTDQAGTEHESPVDLGPVKGASVYERRDAGQDDDDVDERERVASETASIRQHRPDAEAESRDDRFDEQIVHAPLPFINPRD